MSIIKFTLSEMYSSIPAYGPNKRENYLIVPKSIDKELPSRWAGYGQTKEKTVL
jgi:hypothetical protein